MIAHQEKKLGRGLSALLGDSKSKAENQEIIYSVKSDTVELISLNKITAGMYQPRRFFNSEEIQQLANSIRENGLLQPIILRKSDDEGHYEIIAGERRFRAVKMLGQATIPAIVKKVNNHQALEWAIVENVQREDLTLIEEATSYKQLMEEFAYTQEDVAEKTGKSRTHIANVLRILGLPKAVKDLIDDKKLSMGHARALVSSKNPEALARNIIENELTVRDVEEILRDEKIEKLKKDPVISRKESSIKFVNSGELTDLENSLSQSLESKVKIYYNQFKDSGKMTIYFDDIAKIYELAKKLDM